MFSPQQTSTAMELLPLLCLLLSCSAGTSADQNGPVIVKEESDAILPCSLSTKLNIEKALFDWKKKEQINKDVFLYDDGSFYGKGRSGQDEQFKGRVSHFPDELKYGNASIIIRNTKVTDSGNYTCEFPDLQQSPVLIELVVDRILKDRSAENIPGAAAKPSVTILGQTNDGVLLQCEVQGAFPKPTVEWQDSAGNKLPAEEPQVSERGGRYDIILQTTVMKTDRYRCVATQEEIKHHTHAKIYVPLNGSPIGWVVGGVFVTLLVVGVILAFLVFTGCIKLSCKEDKKKPNTGNTDPSKSDPLSKSAEDLNQTE